MITGHYCRTSQDKPECTGKTTDIEIKNLGEWKTYDVEDGLYQVSLQAVAEDGTKSQEWTDSVDVPSKGVEPWAIAAPIVIILSILVIIAAFVGWYNLKKEQIRQEKVPMSLPSKPGTSIEFVDTPERMSAPPSPINRCRLLQKPEPRPPATCVVPSGNETSYNLPKMHKASRNNCDNYAIVVMKNNQDLSEADDSSDEESCSAGTYTPDTSSTSGFGSGRSNQPFETSDSTDPYRLGSHLVTKISSGGDGDDRYPGGEHDTGENHEQKTLGVLDGGLESADANPQLSLKKWTDEFPVQCFQEPLRDPKDISNQVNCDDVPVPPSTQVDSGDSCADRIPYERSASGTSGESLSEAASGEPTTGNSGASNGLSYVKVTVNNPIFDSTDQAQEAAFTCLPALDDEFTGLGEEDFRGSRKDNSHKDNSEEGQETKL